MWHYLALEFGATVAELKVRMGGAEFVRWCALYEIEPFGGRRTDIHFAQLLAMIANVNRGKDRSAFSPDDFMPKWWKKVTELDGRTLLERFRIAAVRANIEMTNES